MHGAALFFSLGKDKGQLKCSSSSYVEIFREPYNITRVKMFFAYLKKNDT